MRTIGSRSYLRLLFIALAFIGLAIPVAEAMAQSQFFAHPGIDTVPVVPRVQGRLNPAMADPTWPAAASSPSAVAPDTPAPTPTPTDVTAYGDTVMSGISTLQKDAIPIWNSCNPDPTVTACAKDIATLRNDTQAMLSALQTSTPPTQFASADADLRLGLKDLTNACDAYSRWLANPNDTAAIDTFQTDVAQSATDMGRASSEFANEATYQ